MQVIVKIRTHTKIALEELLTKKIGKKYKIEPKIFKINLLDVINFITNPNTNSHLATTLTYYFEKSNDISEKDKIYFL